MCENQITLIKERITKRQKKIKKLETLIAQHKQRYNKLKKIEKTMITQFRLKIDANNTLLFEKQENDRPGDLEIKLKLAKDIDDAAVKKIKHYYRKNKVYNRDNWYNEKK